MLSLLLLGLAPGPPPPVNPGGIGDDGLRLQLAGVDVISLRALPAGAGLAGVTIAPGAAAAARNGPGTGRIQITAAGIAWTAPGSATAGTPQLAAADGTIVLPDGEDPSRYLKIDVHAAYLPQSGGCDVLLAESYSGLMAADLTAAQALAGAVTTIEYTLANVSPSAAQNVLLWIDPAPAGAAALSVSSDGVNYFAPTSSTDSHVLSWPSIAAGGSATVWVKRTIAAAAASDPGVLSELQWQWESLT